MDYEFYLSDKQTISDFTSSKEFGSLLILSFKRKNVSEGINIFQAIHLHERLRNWQVVLPEANGGTKYVDLMNMILSGDIETACVCLQYGVADQMDKHWHWVTQERIDWVVNQMKAWLGWA